MLEFNRIPMDELMFMLNKLHRLLNYDDNIESRIFFSIKFLGFPKEMDEEKIKEIQSLFAK